MKDGAKAKCCRTKDLYASGRDCFFKKSGDLLDREFDSVS